MSHDPLAPHSHDPNPAPPSPGAEILLKLPGRPDETLEAAALSEFPRTSLKQQMILSTGHPATGPFDFEGVTLLDLLQQKMSLSSPDFVVEVVSGDGFGTRVQGGELFTPDPGGPIMLTDKIDDEDMSREQGLIRLIVPSEKDDALRQVKWIGKIRVIWHEEK